jgi:hypothetical protein
MTWNITAAAVLSKTPNPQYLEEHKGVKIRGMLQF